MRLLIFASGTYLRPSFPGTQKITVSASSSFWMPLCPPVQNLCCVPCATHSTYLDQGAQRWCTCCYKRKSSAESSRPQRTTRCMAALVVVESKRMTNWQWWMAFWSSSLSCEWGFDQTFSLPSHDDMADELREPTVEDMKNYPEAIRHGMDEPKMGVQWSDLQPLSCLAWCWTKANCLADRMIPVFCLAASYCLWIFSD